MLPNGQIKLISRIGGAMKLLTIFVLYLGLVVFHQNVLAQSVREKIEINAQINSFQAETREVMRLYLSNPHASFAMDISPAVRAFSGQREWILLESLKYNILESGEIITIPAGFVTDFATIPQEFWSLGLSPTGQYGLAAVVHDYLYWYQPCSRSQSDAIMLHAMRESRVKPKDIHIIYQGVRIGGEYSWRENKKNKDLGYPKVVPEKLRNILPSERWKSLQNLIFESGWSEEQPPKNPHYCSMGDDESSSIDSSTRTKKVLPMVPLTFLLTYLKTRDN